MNVTHSLKEVKAEGVSVNPAFMHTNKLGGYTLLGANGNHSRFFGQHVFKEWQLYKFLDEIRLLGTEATQISNFFGRTERHSNRAIETFRVFRNSLLYEVKSFKGFVNLWVDCRHIYDYDEFGRLYHVYLEGDKIIIEYTKHSSGQVQYRLFMAIKGGKAFLRNEIWEQRLYELDRSRGSYPHERWVYNAIKIAVESDTRLVVSAGFNKNDVLFEADRIFKSYEHIVSSLDSYYEKSSHPIADVKSAECSLALACAQRSLLDLLQDIPHQKGIMAGFPWFHQYWTRDEALCLKALMLMHRKDDVKSILLRHISMLGEDGLIPNRLPSAELKSADAVGWVFQRVSEALKLSIFTEDEEKQLFFALKSAIKRLLDNRSKDGLFVNGRLETWMDTYYKDDFREGARIEIQALYLAMIRLAKEMSLKCQGALYPSYERLEDSMRRHVKEVFWQPPVLCDGKGDATIRPNVFLAYYAYPHLLEYREWRKCFDNAIDRLWLNWGGLSSIDKSHTLFFGEYSGENNRSYHRGDSWYFINCMAAICMARLDRKRYGAKIDAILNASIRDILYQGVIGHHAELSSASKQSSQGCLSQAWSAAMLIELIFELNHART